MRIDDINTVVPSGDNVVLQIVEPTTEGTLVIPKQNIVDEKNATLITGKVISVGATADNPNACPGVAPGKTYMMNVFGGYHIATKDVKEMYKLLGGYNLLAELEDIDNINESTVSPVGYRLLIAQKFVDETQDGLVLTGMDARDPRLEDLDYGVVLKVGASCKLGYEVGQLVGYPPYCGEQVKSDNGKDSPALRVLHENDVALTA